MVTAMGLVSRSLECPKCREVAEVLQAKAWRTSSVSKIYDSRIAESKPCTSAEAESAAIAFSTSSACAARPLRFKAKALSAEASGRRVAAIV